MKVAIVIPARLESTRLPRKSLLAEAGKPLICYAIEPALKVATTFVASDSDEILSVVDEHFPQVVRLKTRLANNGTERITQVLDTLEAFGSPDLIINLQSDEPEIKEEHLVALIKGYKKTPGCDIATLATRRTQWSEGTVHVTVDHLGFAIGFYRDPSPSARHHIGIYAYSPRFLRWYAAQPPTHHEQSLSLEQYRALDHGCRIRVCEVDHPYRSIDTRQDYDAFVQRMKDATSTI